jgi:hypothetical protein
VVLSTFRGFFFVGGHGLILLETSCFDQVRIRKAEAFFCNPKYATKEIDVICCWVVFVCHTNKNFDIDLGFFRRTFGKQFCTLQRGLRD